MLNQTVVDPLDYGEEPVLLALRAGQMSLHTDLLLHGSEPNASNRRRCGLTLRFVPAEVRALNGWNGNAVVCRGIERRRTLAALSAAAELIIQRLFSQETTPLGVVGMHGVDRRIAKERSVFVCTSERGLRAGWKPNALPSLGRRE